MTRTVLTETYKLKKTSHLLKLLLPLIFIFFLHSCATTRSPEDIKKGETHKQLGVSYMNNGDYNRAFIEFQQSIQFDQYNKESLNYLGFISARFNNYEDSVAYYKRAIEVDPDYSDAINNLGVTYVEMGRLDDAITQFKSALLNPIYRTPELAYTNMGYSYYKKGDLANAEKSLKNALLRNPILARAMYVLGLVYTDQNKDNDAVKEFIRAIGIFPDYNDAHWELAMIYMKKGQNAKALKHFKIIEEKDMNTERARRAAKYIKELKY